MEAMKFKLAILVTLLTACNAGDDHALRSRDSLLVEQPTHRPGGPCAIDPESQACLHHALMTPLVGKFGRYTVATCIDDPASDACHEHVRQLCASESLIDDCQQLHSAATRCLDAEDWNRDGMVDPSDRAVTDALCIDRDCLANGSCVIEPYPVE